MTGYVIEIYDSRGQLYADDLQCTGDPSTSIYNGGTRGANQCARAT